MAIISDFFFCSDELTIFFPVFIFYVFTIKFMLPIFYYGMLSAILPIIYLNDKYHNIISYIMHLSSESTLFIFYVFYTFYSNDDRPMDIREFHCKFCFGSGEKYLR